MKKPHCVVCHNSVRG